MTDKLPYHVWFAQLEEHPAFGKLKERAQEILDREKDKFWKITDQAEAEAQRLKVQYYDEFWGLLMVYIKNSQNHPNK